MMEQMTIVRCPRCGATDAGAVDHLIEITRMSCGVCGHLSLCDNEDIKDEWNVSHLQPTEAQGLPAFVPALTPSDRGFDMRGEAGEQVRLLVHGSSGFAIALPGRPRWIGPRGTDSAVIAADAMQIIVRRERYHSEDPALLMRRELAQTARWRSLAGSDVEIVETLPPRGGAASMAATYARRQGEEDVIEYVVMNARGVTPNIEAMFLYASFSPARVDMFTWADLRSALGAHQLWVHGELPLVVVWPVVRVSFDDARADKAGALGAMTTDEAKGVVMVLLAEAGANDRPTTPWSTVDSERVVRRLRESVREGIASVLAVGLAEVQTMHDFRSWCRCCMWAVENRVRTRS